MILRLFHEAFEVAIKVFDQVLVEIFAEKMCCDMSAWRSQTRQDAIILTSTMYASYNTCVAIADGFL